MKDSLYTILTRIEGPEAQEAIQNFEKSVKDIEAAGGSVTFQDGTPTIFNAAKLQRDTIRGFENNPVLKDAIDGKISVRDSLSEICDVNIPGIRLLPRKKDKVHNQRVEQISQLIGDCSHMKKRGVFALDNFVAGIAYVTAGMFVGSKLVMYGMEFENNPEDQRILLIMGTYIPVATSLVLGPMFGCLAQGKREGPLHFNKAQYIDSKVEEFYRK